MSFCFADYRLGGGIMNGGMSSVPLGDSGLLDGNYSQLVGASPVLLEDELDAAAKEVTNKKALKNHSEAERRRRERINAHLATLRGMVPACTDKMDKAALLAEVITHVKKLKTNAARISNRCPVPTDADEVTVELVHQDAASSSHGGVLVKATLSCDDGAYLFADVKNALRPLMLKVVGSEVATLGGRVRFTFLMSPECGQDASVVQQALQSVIDKANSALEFAPRASLLNKRRRVSTFESSSSSSCDRFNQPSGVSY